jgi:hypothetical protein
MVSSAPTFSSDEILWYDNGRWGEAGYAVANPAGKTWTNNAVIYQFHSLVGRNMFELMHRGDVKFYGPPHKQFWFDNAGLCKFFGDANAVGYAVWNEKLARYQISALEGDGRHWVLFKNNSGYAAPANGLMTDLGVTSVSGGHTNSRQVMTIGRPSTTLSRSYWVNGNAEVPDGAVGVCCSTESPVEALYESGTPANGEGWGPKPGQWSLAKGFPGFTIVGVTDGGSTIALVRQDPILQLLAKTTAAVASGGTTTSYKVYTGAPGGETDSGLAAVAAYNRSGVIANDTWCWLRWRNNGWEFSPIASPGIVLFKGTLGGSLTNSSSTVSVSSLSAFGSGAAPTGSVTANNPLGLAGSSGDSCVVVQNNSSTSPTYDLLAVKQHVYTLVTDVAFDGTSEKQTKRDLVGMANAAAGSPATIWTGTECS